MVFPIVLLQDQPLFIAEFDLAARQFLAEQMVALIGMQQFLLHHSDMVFKFSEIFTEDSQLINKPSLVIFRIPELDLQVVQG